MRRGIASGALVAALWACAAYAQSGAVLTEAEAARLAIENPAWTGSVTARRSAADARARIAGARPNLQLELTREGTDGLSGSGAEDSARLSYPIDLGGVRAIQRRAGLTRRDAEVAALEATAVARAAEARRLFIEATGARAKVVARRTFSERMDQLAGVVARRVNEGDAAELELRRVDAERAAAQAVLARQDAEATSKWGELQGLIGQAAASYAPAPAIHSGSLAPVETYLALLPNAPEARRQVAEAKAAEVESDALRRRASVPQTALVGGLRSLDNPLGRTTGVIVGATMSLPFGGSARAEAQARAAEASALRAEQRLGDEARRNTLLSAWTATERLTRLTQAEPAVPASLIGPAEAAYQAGEIELSELLSVHRTALDAVLARIDLEQEAALARIRLDELVGKTTP